MEKSKERISLQNELIQEKAQGINEFENSK
jgi:hypothetical protein